VWEADIVYWADSSELGRIAVRTEMKKGTEFFTFSIGKKKHTNVIIRLFFFPSQYFYFSLKGRPDAKPRPERRKPIRLVNTLTGIFEIQKASLHRI
jgi:hypothetical protein